MSSSVLLVLAAGASRAGAVCVCVCVCETRIPQRGESCQHSARNDATSPKKEKKPSLKARQIRPDKLIL